MEKIIKNPAIAGFLFILVLALSGPNAAFAATSPSLGVAATYGVLTGTFNYNIGLTTITGTAGHPVLGVTGAFPGGGASLALTGTTQTATPAYTAAGLAQGNALNNVVDGLNTQVCTPIGAAVALDAVTIGANPPGTFPPGCYSTTGAMTITTGTTVTLKGPGTFIFRSAGGGSTLLPAANSTVFLTPGTSACDVFWAPGAATTIGANSTFVGTIIDDAGITVGNNVTWTGRALAYAAALGNVKLDSDNITVPPCGAPPAVGGGSSNANITVVKTVINDNGGTKTVADFPLFINGNPVVSGVGENFHVPGDAFWVTETGDSNYTRTFSGDCDANGSLSLSDGGSFVCIVTNNDIGAPVVVPPVPPLIDVVKVPSPLALPNGPGKVDYTYTLTNIGTVPVTDITMVGDTCSPIVLASGDTNSDGKLDVNETWVYKCSWNLTETHTNTVTATGWANGISAVDIASSTVIVGKPIVPPLIHVTKVPRPLTLPAGGGVVTYTKKVTNPGSVPLGNVRLTDDKCPNVKYISGDTNRDSMLDPSETWIYDCRTSLKNTTTNTVMATGDANGLRARDYAVATVVVATAVPKLPNTGVAPMGNVLVWPVIAFVILAGSILFLIVRRNKVI